MTMITLGTATVIQADARELPLADDSVDLIITSPPYFGLRSYTDGGGRHYSGQIGDEATPTAYLDRLIRVTRECVRVLKPSGSLFVNLGDKYSQRTQSRRSSHQPGFFPGKFTEFAETWAERAKAGAVRMPYQNIVDAETGHYVREKSLIGIPWRYALQCVDDLGMILRAELIWSKPNGLPESVTDRVRRSHETWFHFTLQPRYFSAVDEIRETFAAPEKPRGQAPNGASPFTGGIPTTNDRNPLGKLPGSVWMIPTQPLTLPESLGVDHYAAYPTEWPKRLIQGWSPTAGVVLDPFGGTGTTALVAKALGRHGITVDMSADYCRAAQWRTNDRQQIAAILDITTQPDHNHPTLFDETT